MAQCVGFAVGSPLLNPGIVRRERFGAANPKPTSLGCRATCMPSNHHKASMPEMKNTWSRRLGDSKAQFVGFTYGTTQESFAMCASAQPLLIRRNLALPHCAFTWQAIITMRSKMRTNQFTLKQVDTSINAPRSAGLAWLPWGSDNWTYQVTSRFHQNTEGTALDTRTSGVPHVLHSGRHVKTHAARTSQQNDSAWRSSKVPIESLRIKARPLSPKEYSRSRTAFTTSPTWKETFEARFAN